MFDNKKTHFQSFTYIAFTNLSGLKSYSLPVNSTTDKVKFNQILVQPLEYESVLHDIKPPAVLLLARGHILGSILTLMYILLLVRYLSTISRK